MFYFYNSTVSPNKKNMSTHNFRKIAPKPATPVSRPGRSTRRTRASAKHELEATKHEAEVSISLDDSLNDSITIADDDDM